MGEAKRPGRVQEKVQKHGPWVAIATAAVIPFFSYMQARSESQAAKTQAHEAQHVAEVQAAKGEKDVDGVEASAGAWVKLLVREQERLGDDVGACHERVDLLLEDLEYLADQQPRAWRKPMERRMEEQRAIERPAAAIRVPKAKGDVAAGDPLGVLLGD
jgi:hypothetical protein